MAAHKFAVGDRVSVLPDSTNGNVRPGVYTIVRALPAGDQGCQYRAKNAMETHERVFHETQLRQL